jgi:hypothetical protein
VNKQATQFRIGLVALMIISAHVLLCLFLLLSQGRVQNKMLGMYKQLVLLGPFFTESRIQATRHLFIRYKKNNTWSPFRDPSQEHFAAYRSSPWRWDKLSYLGYERHLSQAIEDHARRGSFESVRNSGAFRELNGFLVGELIPMPVDSVEVICEVVRYIPGKKQYLLDTTFAFSYNPQSVGEAKQ